MCVVWVCVCVCYGCLLGTIFEFRDVFCFIDFLGGFLFRVRGGVGLRLRLGVVLGLGLTLGLG